MTFKCCKCGRPIEVSAEEIARLKSENFFAQRLESSVWTCNVCVEMVEYLTHTLWDPATKNEPELKISREVMQWVVDRVMNRLVVG